MALVTSEINHLMKNTLCEFKKCKFELDNTLANIIDKKVVVGMQGLLGSKQPTFLDINQLPKMLELVT
eukprot:12328962-Ditylum_brightwellii.AAC.1